MNLNITLIGNDTNVTISKMFKTDIILELKLSSSCPEAAFISLRESREC